MPLRSSASTIKLTTYRDFWTEWIGRKKKKEENLWKKPKINIGCCPYLSVRRLRYIRGKKEKKEKKNLASRTKFLRVLWKLASRDNSTLTQLRGKRTILRMIEIYTWIIAREALRQILHLIKKTMRKPSLSRNEISRVVRVCIVCTIFRSDVDQRCDFVAIS